MEGLPVRTKPPARRTLVADLIEHLSNLGLFLDSCARKLKANGRIVITTPNCFNLFDMASKLTKVEPIMNKDETVYFNHRGPADDNHRPFPREMFSSGGQ